MPILLLLILLALPQPVFSGAQEAELEKIVVLSRHGVRAPTQPERVLSLWSDKTWPAWPVEAGDLTPRGAELVRAMWGALKPGLIAKGILPAGVCPPQNSVYIRADVDERTKATARAIIEGLGQDCKLGYAVMPGKIDPLFHPVKAGLYRFDAIPTAVDVLKMARGGLEGLQDELSGALELIGEISGPPSATLCSRFALMPKCELSDLPNSVSVTADGAGVRIMGSLGIGSSLAEIFLLEYAQWPNEAAGWGRVNARVLGQVMPVHSRVFNIVNRAAVVAWANGSALLNEMSAALLGEHADKRANEAKLVIFVGHDTNIANVGGLLDFAWQASGYPPNGIPPASALFLELWKIGGERQVRARFYAQTPAVLHQDFKADAEPVISHAATETMVKHGDAPVSMSVSAFRQLVAKKTQGAPEVVGEDPGFVYGKAN
ncbi:MAG: histidine-type phosphatase [Desulfovibrio sp.]|nr:histidine-type phosphatase [Desulfovibrio sp.]